MSSLLLQPAAARPVSRVGQIVNNSAAYHNILAPVDVIRPANVTPYTANDVWGGLIHLVNVNRSVGRDVNMRIDVRIVSPADLTVGPLQLTGYFFRSQPSVSIADNATISGALTTADANEIVESRQCTSPVQRLQANNWWFISPFSTSRLALSGRDLWLYIVITGGAYTPGASEKMTLFPRFQYVN